MNQDGCYTTEKLNWNLPSTSSLPSTLNSNQLIISASAFLFCQSIIKIQEASPFFFLFWRTWSFWRVSFFLRATKMAAVVGQVLQMSSRLSKHDHQNPNPSWLLYRECETCIALWRGNMFLFGNIHFSRWEIHIINWLISTSKSNFRHWVKYILIQQSSCPILRKISISWTTC